MVLAGTRKIAKLNKALSKIVKRVYGDDKDHYVAIDEFVIESPTYEEDFMERIILRYWLDGESQGCADFYIPDYLGSIKEVAAYIFGYIDKAQEEN